MKKEESLEILNSVYQEILNMDEEDISDFNKTVEEYRLKQEEFKKENN